MSEGKRNLETGDKARPICKYGTNCYRKNPVHFEEYRHPGYDSDTDDDDCGDGEDLQKSPPAKRQKLESGSTASGSSSSSGNGNQDTHYLPFLLTTVRGIPSDFNTRNMAVSIKDILSNQMGELEASVQVQTFAYCSWKSERDQS